MVQRVKTVNVRYGKEDARFMEDGKWYRGLGQLMYDTAKKVPGLWRMGSGRDAFLWRQERVRKESTSLMSRKWSLPSTTVMIEPG